MPQNRHHFYSITVCLLTSMLSLPVFAGRLVVQLDKQPSEIIVHAALMSEQVSDWSNEPVAITSSASTTLIFENIPAGRYAIQLFADRNANSRLDSSPHGLPLEPVGFSNNPSLLRGKPNVAQCVFHHSGGDTSVHIRLISATPQQRQLTQPPQ